MRLVLIRSPADADPLPPLVVDDGAVLQRTRLGGYDVFPPSMNAEERKLAELLDDHRSGRVKWWLRLQESSNWAVTLILPTGRRFFPDFAVGIEGRATPDRIALVEVEDDGVSGRLHSDDSRVRMRVAHQECKSVTWVVRESGMWTNVRLDPELNRIFSFGRFDVELLVPVR